MAQNSKTVNVHHKVTHKLVWNLENGSQIVSMIRKYHNHKLQTYTWHREEEPQNNHETPGRQIKQSNQVSTTIKMITNLEWTQSNAQQNVEQLQNPTMWVTIKPKRHHMYIIRNTQIKLSNWYEAKKIARNPKTFNVHHKETHKFN